MAEEIEVRKPTIVKNTEIENIDIKKPTSTKPGEKITLKPTSTGFVNTAIPLPKSNFVLDVGAHETQQAMIKATDAMSKGVQTAKQSEAYKWVQTGIGTVPLFKPLTGLNDQLMNGVSRALGDISGVLHSSTKNLVNSELNDFKNKQEAKKRKDHLSSLNNTTNLEKIDYLDFKGVIGTLFEEKDFLMNKGLAFFIQRSRKYDMKSNNALDYKNCEVFKKFPYMLHTQDFYFDFPKKKTTNENYIGVEISKAFNNVEGGNSFGFTLFMDEDLILYKEMNRLIGSYFNEEGSQQIYSQNFNSQKDLFIDLCILTPGGNEEVDEANGSGQDFNINRFVDLFILESIKLTKISNPLKFTHSGSTTFNSKVSGICNRTSLLTNLIISKQVTAKK